MLNQAPSRISTVGWVLVPLGSFLFLGEVYSSCAFVALACVIVQFPDTSFQLHTGLHFSEAAKNLLVPVFPTVVHVVSDTVRLLFGDDSDSI